MVRAFVPPTQVYTLADQGELRFKEKRINGDNYIALRAPAALGASYTWTLPGKLAVYDVTAYGAVGNGIIDDTDAIQSALSLAALNNGAVYIPPGSYLISKTLSISSDVMIYGSGSASKIKQQAPGAPVNTFSFSATASKSFISSLSFIGKSISASIDRCIDINGATEIWIQDCIITTYNIGIHIRASGSRCLVKGNHFSGMVPLATGGGQGYGVLVEASDHNVIIANHFNASGRHDIYLSSGASYNIVSMNESINAGSASIPIYAISTQPACVHNSVNGNLIKNPCSDTIQASAVDAGITLTDNVFYNSIIGNTIEASGRHGLVLEAGPTTKCESNIINENYIKFSQKHGVNIIGAHRNLVSCNRILESSISSAGTYSGIAIDRRSAGQGANYNSIIGNYSSGPTNQKYGIINNDSENIGTYFSGNKVSENLIGAIIDNGSPLSNIDVTSFGAIGDGIHDDTTAIQSALNAMPAIGGLVFIPAGIYLLSTKLQITNPTVLQGVGWSSVLRMTGTTATAIIELTSGGNQSVISSLRFQGSKISTGGTIQRGIYNNAVRDCVIENCLFSGPNSTTGLNFGIDVNGPSGSRTTIINNYFERLVSSSGNGTAVLLEGTTYCRVIGNTIDGTSFNNADGAPGAAIFLSQLSNGDACSDNLISHNIIHDHPQIGIAAGSTTYAEFQTNLGANTRNVIEDNDIYNCKSSAGGDASSGIVLQGNSGFNRILRNKVHANGHSTAGGFGIVLVGSQGLAKAITGATNASPIVITAVSHGFATGNQVGISGVGGNTAANGIWTIAVITADTFSLNGSTGNGAYISGGLVGLTGTPKIDEFPNYTEIVDNSIYQNKDDGIRVKGATYSTIRNNVCYENGQRTANTFNNIYITASGGGANGGNTLIHSNELVGAQPKYQINIGASVSGSILIENQMPAAATGDLLDQGTNTFFGINFTSNNYEMRSTFKLGSSRQTAIDSTGFIEMTEILDPSAGATDRARIYSRDNGAGKTQFCVRFPTGAIQVLATEP